MYSKLFCNSKSLFSSCLSLAGCCTIFRFLHQGDTNKRACDVEFATLFYLLIGLQPFWGILLYIHIMFVLVEIASSNVFSILAPLFNWLLLAQITIAWQCCKVARPQQQHGLSPVEQLVQGEAQVDERTARLVREGSQSDWRSRQ